VRSTLWVGKDAVVQFAPSARRAQISNAPGIAPAL